MRKLFLISIAVVVFCSCDKNKEMVQYTTLYHVENGDTLSSIAIPNSFTPDNDGVNDEFRIYCLTDWGYILSTGFLVEIFDHNGQLIYLYTNNEGSWDATYLTTKTQSGTYDYHLLATDSTGYIYDYRGKVSHMR